MDEYEMANIREEESRERRIEREHYEGKHEPADPDCWLCP